MNPCAFPHPATTDPTGSRARRRRPCRLPSALPRPRYLGFRARWWGGVHIYPLKGVYVYPPPSLWALVYQCKFKYRCNQEDGFTVVKLKTFKYIRASSKVNLLEARKTNSGLFCACTGKKSPLRAVCGATDGSGGGQRQRLETGGSGRAGMGCARYSTKSLFHNLYYGKYEVIINQYVDEILVPKRRDFLSSRGDFGPKSGISRRFRTVHLRLRAVAVPEGARKRGQNGNPVVPLPSRRVVSYPPVQPVPAMMCFRGEIRGRGCGLVRFRCLDVGKIKIAPRGIWRPSGAIPVYGEKLRQGVNDDGRK